MQKQKNGSPRLTATVTIGCLFLALIKRLVLRVEWSVSCIATAAMSPAANTQKKRIEMNCATMI